VGLTCVCLCFFYIVVMFWEANRIGETLAVCVSLGAVCAPVLVLFVPGRVLFVPKVTLFMPGRALLCGEAGLECAWPFFQIRSAPRIAQE
jgi:hypothetical protein